MFLQWVGVLALVHLVCVGADFIFEARLESYQNPTNSRFNSDCCDGPPYGGPDGVCTDPCDNVFIFCVQESTSTEFSMISEVTCPLLLHISSVFQDNDDITFSMNEDFGGGVNNPLSFNGIGTWKGVIFLVRPTESDAEPGFNLGIDTLITSVNISSGSDFFSVTLIGTFSTMMTVSFRVMCTGNSMGPDCSICIEGFQNPASGCTETCTPAQGCSPIGGFCNAPDVCVCRDGYSGDDCDIDLDPCAHTTPCQNGGTCTTTGADQFQCQCVEGYEGDTCELMVTDECDPDPCQNGGTCTDLFRNFECQCVEGYEGDMCELMVTDECDPDPCQNGGTCTDLIADCNCSCASGFTGRNCAEEEEDGKAASDSVSPPVIGVLLFIIATLVVVLVTVLLLKRRQKAVTVTGGGSGQSDTMEIKPNLVYGVSLQQEYYVNEAEKSHDYVYDYVEEAGTATVPIKSNPAYAIPMSENPAYGRHS